MDHSLKMRVQFVVGFTNVGIAITNHPFRNGRNTNYLWWWLGHGLWHCYTYTKTFKHLQNRSWQFNRHFTRGVINGSAGAICGGSKAAERMAQELYPNCPDALVFPVGTELSEPGFGLRDVGMKMISIDDSWWLLMSIDNHRWWLLISKVDEDHSRWWRYQQ